MFSHVVIFWTDPANPKAAEELIAGGEKYLRPIPGTLFYHMGRMATSPRPVVDQSYQVALNIVFPSKQAQDDYQVHPMHVEFVEKVFKRVCKKVLIYDFGQGARVWCNAIGSSGLRSADSHAGIVSRFSSSVSFNRVDFSGIRGEA